MNCRPRPRYAARPVARPRPMTPRLRALLRRIDDPDLVVEILRELERAGLVAPLPTSPTISITVAGVDIAIGHDNDNDNEAWDDPRR